MSADTSGVYEVTPLGDRWAIRWDGEPLLVVNEVSTAVSLVAGAQRALARSRRPSESPSFAPQADLETDDAPFD
jgi:hypothetical protein